jgi:hypothetical protein
MKNLLFFFSVIYLSSCGPANDQKKTGTDNKLFYADSGYSSISVTKDTANGYEVYTRTKKSLDFNVVKLKWGKEYVNMLVRETGVQTTGDGFEGQMGYVEMEGKISENGNLPAGGQGFNKELWKKRFEGNQVNYDWDYFEVMYFACCSSVDGKKVCRYSDGEELLNCTGDLYEIQIPNTDVNRYLGYWDFNSPLERSPELKKDSLCLGMLTMVDPVSRSA